MLEPCASVPGQDTRKQSACDTTEGRVTPDTWRELRTAADIRLSRTFPVHNGSGLPSDNISRSALSRRLSHRCRVHRGELAVSFRDSLSLPDLEFGSCADSN